MTTPARQRMQHAIEYAGLKATLSLVDCLPLGVAETIAGGVADLFYMLNAPRRRLARENIRRAGIADSPAEADRIARAAFRSFALVAVESLNYARYMGGEHYRERAVFDIPADTLAQLQRPEQGMIVVTAHLGNWEVGGKLLSHLKPVTAIARKMNNPLTERVLERRNAGTRVTLTPKRDADARRFIRALRRGDALALLVDQHARDHGLMVDFFGTPASTYPTPALLHLRTRAPLIFGCCLRTGPMNFRLVLNSPIEHAATGDRDLDVRLILAEINRQVETAIRGAPEQYLWGHRRWRDGKRRSA
jgi:Kdo2-lipid IVA lauroyltransferase/acyltransferase